MDTLVYEAPEVELVAFGTHPATVNPVAVWVIVAGLFAVAVAYATYCRATGGWADIRFGWSGFRVTCYR